MTPVERIEPLHCLGESHCLRFRDRLWRGERPARLLHARSHFLPGVEANNFTADDGLHADLAAALLAAGLCSEHRHEDGSVTVEASHRPTTFATRVLAARHAALADEPLQAPALLLFAGDKELHSLAMAIGPAVDFELPGDPGYGAVTGATRVPYDTVEAAFAARLEPFGVGLRMLRDAGFDRTLVHGLLPRVRDDARNAQWCHGTQLPAILRSKLAIVGNRLLAAACQRAGIGFVDVWPELATSGYLDPRFDLDGLHANHLATEVSLPTIAAALARLESACINDAQYELLHELAVEREPAAEPRSATFAAAGYSLWPAPMEPLRAGAGDERVAAALTQPALRDLLEAGWSRECGLIGITDGTGSDHHATPTKADTARAAIYAADQPLQVRCLPRDESTTASNLSLAAGALLVFDPARVSVQCESPGHGALQLYVLPRLPAEALQVVRLPTAAWPVDPFRVADANPGAPGIVRRWREVAGRTVLTTP
ncbi:MAG: hypothetical protein MUC36_01135 [Planctomycetes bacterium]|jgi:hypothetical protein|nr:hypothetical protein [Planctomycetota bacterium]